MAKKTRKPAKRIVPESATATDNEPLMTPEELIRRAVNTPPLRTEPKAKVKRSGWKKGKGD
jgi:hypothetical protein